MKKPDSLSRYNACENEARETKDIIDHAWSIFENQEDSKREEFVKSAYYFVTEHGFDISALPVHLHDKVSEMIEEDERQRNVDAKFDELTTEY